MDLRHAQDGRLQRVDVAADDRLQRVDDGRRGGDRVDAAVRERAVRAAAGDLDVEAVERRHHRARAHREAADVQPRPVVHAENGVDGKALEQPLVDHDFRAAGGLLGRLEDEPDRPGEIGARGQMLGRGEQHDRMAVVTAGVHPAFVARAMGEGVRLGDGQRVHVGAQTDSRPVAAGERADDARAGESLVHFDSHARELGRDDAGRARLLVRELGVCVDVAPERDPVLAPRGDVGDDVQV